MSGSWAGDAKEDEGSVPSQVLRRKAAALLRAPWRRKIAMARVGQAGHDPGSAAGADLAGVLGVA
jgi:hypothetical protein